jgi:hypothetical protein
MALLLALTMFHHLIDGFRNRDLRQRVRFTQSPASRMPISPCWRWPAASAKA